MHPDVWALVSAEKREKWMAKPRPDSCHALTAWLSLGRKFSRAVAVMHTERKHTKIDGEIQTNRGIELSLEEGFRHLLMGPGHGSPGNTHTCT